MMNTRSVVWASNARSGTVRRLPMWRSPSVKVRSGPPLRHSCHMGRSQSAANHMEVSSGTGRRMSMILERDGSDCVWCHRTFDNHLVVPTTEHLDASLR